MIWWYVSYSYASISPEQVILTSAQFLQHLFEIQNKDGSKETIASTLCEYGAPVGSGGYTAMAKLVGIPCGVAVKQVLDGTISERGILAPVTPSLNKSLMKELKEKHG